MNKFKEFAEAGNRLIKACERVKETLKELDDSEPKVWLTVEEAKDIKYHLNNLTIISGILEDHFRSKPIFKLLNLLRDRIERAEAEK